MEILLLQHKNKLKEKFTSVILCAGEGVRARNFAKSIPKPLTKVKSLKNRSILSLIISNLAKLKLRTIVVVTGHLGERIEDFLTSPQIKNQFSKENILINSSGARYKLGPLHSFLSITTNKQIFKDDKIFIVFPGDTVFDSSLLQEVLSLLLENYTLLKDNSIIFYRKIRTNDLVTRLKKYYPNQEITISYLRIEEKGLKKTVKEISQKQLNEFSNEEFINQIIPIFIFNYAYVKEIQDLASSTKFSYIREVVNFMIKKNKVFQALTVNPEYNFYDIDTQIDLKNLNEKIKGGQ
ncbi:MAG: NTP transferase domain-containing protein [Promethearchaeota archaeon]